jgi:hypothetical protein
VTGTQPCGLPPCPEHNGQCAYHGDEPDRCPWCHATWAHILGKIASGNGQHSCEMRRVWSFEQRTQRMAAALRMRQRAELLEDNTLRFRTARPWRGDRSTHCPHRAQDVGRLCFEPLYRLSGDQA